jgi:putative nucleotidyltransferase with HDIG domain
MTRNDAWQIVQEYVKNRNLQKHMLAVEAAMAAYAKKYHEPEEAWLIAGLLHDFDWEIHPSLDEHPQKGAGILRQRGVDELIIHAVLSHADHTGVKRETTLEKALYAVDELTGLIVAVTLVRPTKNIDEVTVENIKKKWPQKSFAAGVNRDQVMLGANALGVDLWSEHVPLVLSAMQSIASDLGLSGSPNPIS